MTDSDESSIRNTPLEGRSANHFSVAFTAYEFLLDFGQAYEGTTEPFIHTRIILTPYSARALSEMLQDVVRQYAETVGPIPQTKK